MVGKVLGALAEALLRIVGWLALGALLVSRGRRVEREKQAQMVAQVRREWAERWAARPRSRAELVERLRKLARRRAGRTEPASTKRGDADLSE